MAARYFHTTRHLKPQQIIGRLQAQLKKRVRVATLPQPPATLQSVLKTRLPFLQHDPWNTESELREGRFCFLNCVVTLGWPPDWKVSGLPLLWQFNLHYFNYLCCLEKEQQQQICRDWIQANPVDREPAWHPYPTSLRLVNWCKASLNSAEVDQSIYKQAAFLSRNLETYHPGNHLLENARALIFAGSYFKGQGEAPNWLEKGVEIYLRETPVQVLSDGGYFERSPMYHAIVLEGYLDIINILPPADAALPLLTESVEQMSDFLVSVTHPDGNIALLNDSTHEIAPPTRALLRYAKDLLGYEAKSKHSFAESGYFIHQNNEIYLIIDGGPIGPNYLPAHAHADIFSYELSVQGRPFIVDSGVFEYSAGAMRSYVRSTPAHNTVTIDGVDQAECWDSFRVARRFAPNNVSFNRNGSRSRFEGTFKGYAELIGDRIVHRRVITCDDDLREIEIIDTVEGRGTHVIESLLHFHPTLSVENLGDRVSLKTADAECVIETHGASMSSREGWFCPEFGLRKSNKVLVLGGECSLPVQLSYRIRY